MKKKPTKHLVPQEKVEDSILVIRGHKVMLDSDLAKVYGVTTARLNQQVRRNLKKFPADFLFQLTAGEFERLMLQIATSNRGRGGRRKLPFVFTEHGAVMTATILNTPQAIAMSVFVVRAFVRLREIFVANQILEDRLAEIEAILLNHDAALQELYKKIKPLLLSKRKTRAIGFHVR